MARRGTQARRARVHFPCTHTPSTIRRPLAAPTWNAIPDRRREGRGKWRRGEVGGERIRSRELKLEKHGGRDKERQGKRGRVDRKNLGERHAAGRRTIKKEREREGGR